MTEKNEVDNKKKYSKLAKLISEGESIIASGHKHNSKEAFEWFEQVNIFNERYLKDHPSHSSIHSVYFHSKNVSDSLEVMVSKLRAVQNDDDFFPIKEKTTDSISNTSDSETKVENTDTAKVFISYSWDSDKHKRWVKGLADSLLNEGINVLLDQYDVSPGGRLTSFMESSISDCDYVLVICTPEYKTKADGRLSGVGYESNIITGELLQKHNDLKFIPILRNGGFDDLPTYMNGKLAIDLRSENKNYDLAFQDLLTTLRGESKKPPIRNSVSHNHKAIKTAVEESPIHITGIITDEVTLPRNDGTRGSALYSIPFRLSGYPNQRWCDIFIECWNHPLSFTTMHRPGIASVIGNKIILNGTTIEEVQKYHRDTLVAAVKRANDLLDQENQKRQRELERQKQIEEEHNKKISDIASNIDFE